MSKIEFRDPFDRDANLHASLESAIYFDDDPGKTDQSGKDDADVNVILRRFGVTGQLPEARRLPEWGVDFSNVVDYQTAQNQLIEAQDLFYELPAELRKRFENDPAQFMDYVARAEHDPKAKETLREFGLLAPEPVVEPPQTVRIDKESLDAMRTPPKEGNVDPGGN